MTDCIDKASCRSPRTDNSGGFTLAELAIVLLIVTLLVGGLLAPLSAQVENRNIAATQRTVADVREALLGFAAAQGRLPCPALASSPLGGHAEVADGRSSPEVSGHCAKSYVGYVPGITLGITPTDNLGFALDAWGNRIRYAVTPANSDAFTTTDGMKTATLGLLAPNLRVCADSACASILTNTAVAVIYSLGKTPNDNGGSDETQNNPPDPGDNTFVNHEFREGGTGGRFDHVVTWLSPNILYNRMIAAGRLP